MQESSFSLSGVQMTRNYVSAIIEGSGIYSYDTYSGQKQQIGVTNECYTHVPVLLEIGDTTLQVVDRCGNAVFCDQLRPRRIYDIRIHTASKLATVLCRLPSCTTGANPVLNPPTAPTPPAN